MKVLAGTSNSKLCKDIARQLKLKLVNSKIKRFADGEVYVEINENIRGNSIFVVQSTSNPANDNLMELLICIDALRRSSAKNITAVIPDFDLQIFRKNQFLLHNFLFQYMAQLSPSNYQY